jgi:hypothetical protein
MPNREQVYEASFEGWGYSEIDKLIELLEIFKDKKKPHLSKQSFLSAIYDPYENKVSLVDDEGNSVFMDDDGNLVKD